MRNHPLELLSVSHAAACPNVAASPGWLSRAVRYEPRRDLDGVRVQQYGVQSACRGYHSSWRRRWIDLRR
eukprot:1476447-Pyramimonas_sp.AAC.1